MSDLNDDLLNDDLGEDLDDQALLGADEDELLLSDEELEKNVSTETKAQIKDEAEKWVNSKLKTNKSAKSSDINKKTDDIVTTSSSMPEKEDVPNNVEESPKESVQAESDVSTSEESPSKQEQTKNTAKNDEIVSHHSKNDEVTSTNKEIEDQVISQTPDKTLNIEIAKESVVGGKPSDEIQSSQGDSSATELYSDPREDPEERSERTNIKLKVERSETDSSPEKIQSGRFFGGKRGRGGIATRGSFMGARPPMRFPHPYQQYSPNPNENINPQVPNYYSDYNPADQYHSVRPPYPLPSNIGPRMDYRPPVNAPFRNPNDFTIYRSVRPDFQPPVNGGNFPQFSVQNARPMYRPDMSVQTHRFEIRTRMPTVRPVVPMAQGYGPRGPVVGQHIQSVPPPAVPGGVGNMSAIVSAGQQPSTQNPVMPRKVLINPNFKGGVEAAKNQLLKDTQFMQSISSHVSHLQSDEELLRQQEEFINKNRMHIEKRRYERSPERNRSRERSYSPPRRERRGDSRERRNSPRARNRYGYGREFESRNTLKRRRSCSPDRRRENTEEEEDEETRAYRLEIEKQKAMREKILRDKEMRRRKAAEEKELDEKPIPTAAADEQPKKLTPIIVTESKIISLKKKRQNESAAKTTSTSSNLKDKAILQQQTIQRTIPTAKILPETKKSIAEQCSSSKDITGTTSMAVIKPVMKKTIANTSQPMERKDDMLDETDLEEELLLADTPSPPSSPKNIKIVGISLADKTLISSGSNNSGNNKTAGIPFTSKNRRVVLKTSSTAVKDQDSDSNPEFKKGIFDRLEKKIGVNESVKRKIQRIVIKNAE